MPNDIMAAEDYVQHTQMDRDREIRYAFLAGVQYARREDMSAFDAYQERCRETAICPPGQALEYTALGLTSEAGEVAGKIKKIIRDKDSKWDWEDAAEVALELGDVLWYVASLADHLDVSLGSVAAMSLDKLASRKEHGTLPGDGDHR